MASTRLTKTFSSSGNRNKWTISMWIKRSKISATQTLFACHQNNNYKTRLEIASDDELYFNDEYNGNTNGRIVSNAKLRDTNAWYHIVGIWDKDNSTSGDKIRFYINGERVTSFSDTGNAPANASTLNVDGQVHEIGAENNGNQFDGYMSHIHFCDGYAYLPSEFGETDSTTGIWKAKTAPSVNYGTNGFFILKDGNSVTDSSSNTNNWTVASGTLTDAKDCPDNVFATWNPLAAHPSNTPTFSNGNNTVVGVDTSSQTVSSTLAMPSKGKWYCEMKLTQEANATSSIPNFGIIDAASLYKFRNQELISYNGGVNSYGGRVNSTNLYVDGSSSGTISSAPDVGNIMGLAVDLDSSPNTLKYYLNGALVGTQNINNDEYVFACSIKNDNNAGQVDVNFGNGYFGTTAISSEGANASGNGKFEYDVPSGYTALCTKGLNL